MTPLERLREAAAVPADDVTVSRTDLVALLETFDKAMKLVVDQGGFILELVTSGDHA